MSFRFITLLAALLVSPMAYGKVTKAEQPRLITLAAIQKALAKSPSLQADLEKNMEKGMGIATTTIQQTVTRVARYVACSKEEAIAGKKALEIFKEALALAAECPDRTKATPAQATKWIQLETEARQTDLSVFGQGKVIAPKLLVACIRTLRDAQFQKELTANFRQLHQMILTTPTNTKLYAALGIKYEGELKRSEENFKAQLADLEPILDNCVKLGCEMAHNELVKLQLLFGIADEQEIEISPESAAALIPCMNFYANAVEPLVTDARKHIKFEFVKSDETILGATVLKYSVKMLTAICDDLIQVCEEKAQ